MILYMLYTSRGAILPRLIIFLLILNLLQFIYCGYEPKERAELRGLAHSIGKGEGRKGWLGTWQAATRHREGCPGRPAEARNRQARRRSVTGGAGEENSGMWAGLGKQKGKWVRPNIEVPGGGGI
jgi:hypothetical protein